MERESQIEIRVYLEDTDAGGVVYHGSYVRFMERVRTEWLRGAGLQQSETYEEEIGFVIHKLTMAFHRPAKLDAELLATCRVEKAKAASILFSQEVKDAQDGTVYCSAEASIACVNSRTLAARRLPDALRTKLSQLC